VVEANVVTTLVQSALASSSVPTKPPASVTCGSKSGHRAPECEALCLMNPEVFDNKAPPGGSSQRLYRDVADVMPGVPATLSDGSNEGG
jgi:hypothetical protein